MCDNFGMKEAFGGWENKLVQIEHTGSTREDLGVNLGRAQEHIEENHDKILDGEALMVTQNLIGELRSLQNEYPESEEIQSAIVLLVNLVARTHKKMAEFAEVGVGQIDADLLRKDVEKKIH